MMNRLARFLRSVVPADPFQLCFVAGLVCLTIAPHLGWRPSHDLLSEIAESGRMHGEVWRPYYQVVVVATFGYIFAVSAGYFLCFWPGKRPTRKVGLLVLLPAAASTLAIAAKYVSLRTAGYSALAELHGSGRSVSWLFKEAWTMGNGLHFAVLGIVFIAVFFLRLLAGRSTLPLTLVDHSRDTSGSQANWEACQSVIWMSVAPITAVVIGLLGTLPTNAVRILAHYSRPALWMSYLQGFLVASATIAIALSLAGAENRKSVYRLLRLGKPIFLLTGLALPLLVTLSPAIVRFLLDRVHWAAQDYGRYAPPRWQDYLPVPEWWTIALVFAAFAEEVIFRGVLQSRFVDRYGARRGIFLVGIVWAGCHFFTDSYSTFSPVDISIGLLHRIALCLAMGFALAWLTLRSGSLFPATVAHWTFNVGHISLSESPYIPGAWVELILWLLIVCVLFRLWPLKEAEPQLVSTTEPLPASGLCDSSESAIQ